MLSVGMKDQFSTHILEPYSAPIAEMADNPEKTDDFAIEVDTSKVENILKRDKNPMFVTLPVACEGKSVNGRNYTAENVESIVEQINNNHPDGYAGHLTDEERSTKTPDAQTIWLGAVVKDVDGKKVAYAKGYVLPSAKKRREYLQVAKDVGKKVSVSIYGEFDGWYDKAKKTYDIAKVNLESIDWSRPGAEGLPIAATPLIASEMKGNQGKDDAMEKVEALKSATLSEMQEHNPDLVKEIEETSGTVSEMADIRKQLGVDDKAKVTDTIAEMQKTIREHTLSDELRERVKVPQARPIIRQMVISEMKADESVTDTIERVLKSEDAKVIMSNKSGAPQLSLTNDERRQQTARKFTKV
jgi:hypothetical protein